MHVIIGYAICLKHPWWRGLSGIYFIFFLYMYILTGLALEGHA